MQQGSTPALPVIDLAPLHSGSDEDVQAVAEEISAACAVSGFFYVSGHGISQAAIENLRET